MHGAMLFHLISELPSFWTARYPVWLLRLRLLSCCLSSVRLPDQQRPTMRISRLSCRFSVSHFPSFCSSNRKLEIEFSLTRCYETFD